jgi:hypothetical protein
MYSTTDYSILCKAVIIAKDKGVNIAFVTRTFILYALPNVETYLS